jgi:hypothetical protein
MIAKDIEMMRDIIATQAMAAEISKDGMPNYVENQRLLAKKSYAMANEMLKMKEELNLNEGR